VSTDYKYHNSVRYLTIAVLPAICLLLPAPTRAQKVVSVDGHVTECRNYRLTEKTLFCGKLAGKEIAIILDDIDSIRTRELNERESNPPLNLPADFHPARAGSDGNGQESVAEAARKASRREQNTTTSKRVFTDDDFRSSSPPAMQNETSKSDTTVSHEKIGQGLQEVATYTEQEFAKMALGSELNNYEFPDRAQWQRRLYAARQSQIADLRLCISDRVSDNNGAQGTACSRTNLNKYKVESLEAEGRGAAQAWRRRQ
jgi:hypothetical protein